MYISCMYSMCVCVVFDTCNSYSAQHTCPLTHYLNPVLQNLIVHIVLHVELVVENMSVIVLYSVTCLTQLCVGVSFDLVRSINVLSTFE